MSTHEEEIASGKRFAFGKNWAKFLLELTDERILLAERSLTRMLDVKDFVGKTFIDVGSGSGLFSLAARRLGAKVHSFDFDPNSVGCTQELKRRYFVNDPDWKVDRASVLDTEYTKTLGCFDVVYSWGVLHHTGEMWKAFENVVPLIAPGGRAFIAIYNDQGGASHRWKILKRLYCSSGKVVRALILGVSVVRLWGLNFLIDVARGRPGYSWRAYASGTTGTPRGMSAWRDVVDWVGGYPFEVARPEEIFDYFRSRGFHLDRLTTCGGGLGCNEFVFTRNA